MKALEPNRPDLMKRINRFLDNEKPKRILDVGGMQVTYDHLKGRFPDAQVIVFNIVSKDLPTELHDKKDGFLIANAEKLPFKDDYFDIVYGREVLEHFYRPDLFIEETKRVLKNNGKLILSTPNLNSWHVRMLILFGFGPTNYTPYPGRVYGIPKFFKTKTSHDHVRVFPYKALKEIFNSNGFVLEGINGVMTYSESVWMPKLRKLIGFFLPGTWKEGVVIKSRVVK